VSTLGQCAGLGRVGVVWFCAGEPGENAVCVQTLFFETALWVLKLKACNGTGRYVKYYGWWE